MLERENLALHNKFDVILVGAGAAGCQLALDLAAEGCSVALVEAGGPVQDVRSTVPIYYPKLFGSRYDYQLQTEPEKGLRNRRIAWPRGKGVGGSTAINAQIFLQASQGDFDRWGWNWASQYGDDLCVKPESPRSVHPWSKIFVEAAQHHFNSNIPKSKLQSEGKWTGVFQRFNHQGRRLHPGMLVREDTAGQTREKIQLVEQAHVVRVELQGERATGVVLESGGSQQRIAAARAVVLCAGVIGSPQLLVSSGIGARETVENLGGECRVELDGVGKNLQDHLVYPIVYEVQSDEGLPQRHCRKSREQFRQHGNGDLVSNIAEAGAIYGLSGSQDCDFQIHFTPTHYLKYPRTARSQKHMSLAITDLHPKSRGELKFERNAAGKIVTRIHANYLDHYADIDRLCFAVSTAREIAKQSAFSILNPTEVSPGRRGCKRAALEKSIRSLSQSIYHPVGTCGAKGGDDRVLDEEFRVLGTERLYVADGSALPDLPSANPSAAIMLLAKHVAAAVLNAST